LYVFSQLYSEADPDQDVSPDTEDPEAAGESFVVAVCFVNLKWELIGIKMVSVSVIQLSRICISSFFKNARYFA